MSIGGLEPARVLPHLAINEPLLLAFMRAGYLGGRENALLLGGCGTGKTQLASPQITTEEGKLNRTLKHGSPEE